jgi:hypothetical protein
METYELTPDHIVDWAMQHASYEELQLVAKTVYGIYVDERKHEHPTEQKANRKAYMQRKRKAKRAYR